MKLHRCYKHGDFRMKLGEHPPSTVRHPGGSLAIHCSAPRSLSGSALRLRQLQREIDLRAPRPARASRLRAAPQRLDASRRVVGRARAERQDGPLSERRDGREDGHQGRPGRRRGHGDRQDPAAVADIRARIQALVEAQKNAGTNVKHTGNGEGGGLLGRCPIVLKDTTHRDGRGRGRHEGDRVHQGPPGGRLAAPRDARPRGGPRSRGQPRGRRQDVPLPERDRRHERPP